MAVAVESGAAITSATSLAANELIRAISATNRASGRRTCTMVLNQLEKEILPNITRSSLLELLADYYGHGDDVIAASDCFSYCDDNRGPSIFTTLIMILSYHDEFSTEGHREASVEILKYLFRRAFGVQHEFDARQGLDAVEEKRLCISLIKLFLHCSRVFQKRMSIHNASNNDSFHPGTVTGPMEPSEHIRLLMVELMTDLGGYCLTSCRKDCFTTEDENCNKMLIEATSIICQTLAKSTLLDPYPEIPRAACDLVKLLAHLCPLAVRMNATRLMAPITGRFNDSAGGVDPPPTAITASISKKCLMRHRHAKTRCQAVHASVGIVLCCPEIGTQVKDVTSASAQSDTVGHLSKYGSPSTSMEHVLQHNILPEWEELLKVDTSASVKLAVIKSLGSVANTLKWRYYQCPTITSQCPLEFATHYSNRLRPNTATTDITTMVEAQVLTLLLLGVSSGCVADVRSLAAQQLRGLACEKNGGTLPKHVLISYFTPVMELLLSSCSNVWAVCQWRVVSLETLQVLLSIAIPLMNEGCTDPSTSSVKILVVSDAMICAIVNILTMNILSDEKAVVETAFSCCRTLGANDFMSNNVLGFLCDLDDLSASVTNGDTSMAIQSNESEVARSPRHLTSQLLIIDGLLKGSTNSKDATSILCEVDRTSVPSPNWFHASLSPATAIAKFFRHTAKYVSLSSSLAWALAETCDSFIKSVHDFESNLSLTEDIIVNVLVSVAYLLGCPVEYGISSNAEGILRSFSFPDVFITRTSATCEEEGLSLFDVHFRKVFVKIISTAPQYPWKQSEPTLLAVSALLRTCSGSTIRSNFDLVAPFFVTHLSTTGYNSNSSDGTISENAKDEMAEEYSLRISLMALLQTILTDERFPQTLRNQQCGVANTMASTSSAQFTADVIMSLVIPNLVWRVGGMASALRKMALATLFSLLIGRKAVIHPDTLPRLIPTLHSSFDDSESSIRELSCLCLSLTLQQIPDEKFSLMWENSPHAIDTILPRLVELLDDNHAPVRIAACSCLRVFYPLVQSNMSLSSHEKISASLFIHLDDPDGDFQADIFQTLLELIEYHHKDSGFVQMMERQINASMKSHRDPSRCRELLAKLADF